MKHRQTDTPAAVVAPEEPSRLAELVELPRPLYGSTHSLPNRAIVEPHDHPWAQLSHALRGTQRVETETGHFLAPPGRAVWVPAGMRHAVTCSPGTLMRSLYIEPAAMLRPRPECEVIVVSPLLRELIQAFSELPVRYDDAGADGRLVGVLLDRLAVAEQAGLMLPWPEDPRLGDICRQLQEKPADRSSIEDHACRLGVSGRTLSRWFLHQTGLTFRQWRQRCRVLASIPALERGERVTDAALGSGYESMSAFIAAFQEQLGATPKDFFSSDY
ncbi:helix-turn-helix domain-containing protein [Billgrantia antri]|uniref:Helix-turn-helix transcriptional regulator n=1 Tax=Billgrantia antri TaxID=2846777 RepID=A0ABS6ZLU4_9GAMM|nr:helix-turn-helix transcriptional regulator [Halomonas antri]